MRVTNNFTIGAVVVLLGLFRVNVVDAQKLRTARSDDIIRLEKTETFNRKTLRQYINSLEIGDERNHHRLLTRLLAKTEENSDNVKCSECINLAENITREDSSVTTDNIDTKSTTKAVPSTITVTSDPAQCFEDIQTWLIRKVALSSYLILFDVFFLAVGITYGIPCLLGIETEDCELLYQIIRQLIYTSFICLIFFPINLINGFLTCGNPTVLDRFGPQFNLTIDIGTTLDKKNELMGTLMDIIARSGDKTRRLLPDFDGATSEQTSSAKQFDKMLQTVSAQTIQFLVNDINENYIDDESEFEFQHIAGRYLQSTSVANQTIRTIPDLFLQGYDEFQKSFLNSTSSTMTVNELRSMLDTVLSSIPYDPNGIDAQIKFNFDKDTLAKLTKHTSTYLSKDDRSRRLFAITEDDTLNGGSTTQTRRIATAAETQKCTMEDFMTCTPSTIMLDSIELDPSTATKPTGP